MKRRGRIEKDALGSREVPTGVYYGIQTLRAIENFTASGLRPHPGLVHAYLAIKKSCALTNQECGSLNRTISRAVIRASDELLRGKLADQFVVDVYQAGAGTSLNMNLNEVLANRALELLGRRRGEYAVLNPNDHVNMSQSTNDTYPTAARIAVLWEVRRLLLALRSLQSAFSAKSREFRPVVKSARTHLMDALPISLGQEFRAYASALGACRIEIERRTELLRSVPLGGTATGTGANTPRGFRRRAVRHLARLTGLPLTPAKDIPMELQSHQPFTAVSSALKELALELIRVSNDLQLLASGPTTGLAEIRLPAVQPGSSMMPGKVNPSILECLKMVSFQVIGLDTSASLAAQAGQLDLNVNTPLTTYCILESARLFSNFLPQVTKRCVRGVKANTKRCRAYRDRSPSLVTLLAPRIGYTRAAALFQEADKKGMPVAKMITEHGLLTRQELERLLDPHYWEENQRTNKRRAHGRRR